MCHTSPTDPSHGTHIEVYMLPLTKSAVLAVLLIKPDFICLNDSFNEDLTFSFRQKKETEKKKNKNKNKIKSVSKVTIYILASDSLYHIYSNHVKQFDLHF